MKTQLDVIKGQLLETMAKPKVDAFLKEFPFTKKYVKNTGVARVYVSRIEPVILNYAPLMIDTAPFWKFFLPEWEEEQIIFFDKFGNFLHQVRFGNKIGITLEMMNHELAESVFYILSYFEYMSTAIVYKTPKGYPSVLEWIRAQTEKEQRQFSKEIEAIDLEGENMLKGILPRKSISFPGVRSIKEGCSLQPPPLPVAPIPPEAQISVEDFFAPMPPTPIPPRESKYYRGSLMPKKQE